MILLFGQMSSRLTMSSMKVLNLVSWKIRNMGLRNSESALDLINIISLGKNSFLDTTSTWFEMCIKQTASLKSLFETERELNQKHKTKQNLKSNNKNKTYKPGKQT